MNAKRAKALRKIARESAPNAEARGTEEQRRVRNTDGSLGWAPERSLPWHIRRGVHNPVVRVENAPNTQRKLYRDIKKIAHENPA